MAVHNHTRTLIAQLVRKLGADLVGAAGDERVLHSSATRRRLNDAKHLLRTVGEGDSASWLGRALIGSDRMLDAVELYDDRPFHDKHPLSNTIARLSTESSRD